MLGVVHAARIRIYFINHCGGCGCGGGGCGGGGEGGEKGGGGLAVKPSTHHLP